MATSASAASFSYIRRGVLSLTSWFHHPSINQRFEVLCRGSGTCVSYYKNNNNNTTTTDHHLHDNLVLIVSHHVCSPFRFPQHYEQPFLSSLREENVRFSIELRDSLGDIISQVRLDPTISKVHGHESRDVAAIKLPHRSLDLLIKGAASSNILLRPLRLSNSHAEEGEELDFIGHFVKPSVDANTGEDISTLVPKNVQGRVKLRARQTFASTSEVLEMGFCGGAVLSRRSSGRGGEGNNRLLEKEEEEEEECIGIVEGIVPIEEKTVTQEAMSTTNLHNDSNNASVADRVKKVLQGHAVYVEAQDCKDLVEKCVNTR